MRSLRGCGTKIAGEYNGLASLAPMGLAGKCHLQPAVIRSGFVRENRWLSCVWPRCHFGALTRRLRRLSWVQALLGKDIVGSGATQFWFKRFDCGGQWRQIQTLRAPFLWRHLNNDGRRRGYSVLMRA